MKNYSETLTICTLPKMYQVIFNDEDMIFYTESLEKAIRITKENAKCQDYPCTYSIYVEDVTGNTEILRYELKTMNNK